MKRIIITTNHPAPYFDRLLEYLRTTDIVYAFYHYRRSDEKPFHNPENSEQIFYSDFSIIKKFLLFRKQDLIIFGGWKKLENIILACSLYFFSKTKVVYMLDHPDPEFTKDGSLYKFIKRTIVYFSSGLFTASNSCRNYMKRKYNINDNKLFIFPYAYSDNTKGIKSINKQRKELIKRGEKISILIANRFINRKGYDIVYEAFNEMDKNNLLNEFDITILGTGNEFDKYKSLFSYFKNINMQGWVSKSAYESILNNCDILVHASHFEPFGIPPVDALARGKYLIVTDKVMSVDFLANKNCEGISFYNSNDYKELYDIFKMLIDKKDLIYKSSADNINIVKSHFNYKHYNTVINKVLSN